MTAGKNRLTSEEIPATLSIRPHATSLGVRASLLVLVAVLIASSEAPLSSWLWWLALVAAATLSVFTPCRSLAGRLARTVEVVIAAAAGAYALGAEGAAIPYIAAPVFAAGMFVGTGGVIPLMLVAAVSITVFGLTNDTLQETSYIVQALEWLVVAGAVGSLGSWIRSLELTVSTEKPGYEHASRLLTQLRTIARQLPGTLDPGGIAERLLDEIASTVPVTRAAVFTTSGGGRLEVLSQRGPERAAWETSVDADTAIGDAWASQQPQITARSLTRQTPGAPPRPPVSGLVLPLVTGVRTVGLVVVESDTAEAYASSDMAAAAALSSAAALRLETALLFDDVRSLATTQERQRLAREIHDGVAQELVMVGYGIDNAVAHLSEDHPATEQLHTLRAEVTRVITELRLSLFELRSDVERHGGLGTAIGEYARAVGTSAGLRVHLSLDESTARLPAAVEAELLRIAQESITNARKHSGADNLWVSCEIDPPNARIEIADDGTGIPETRNGVKKPSSAVGSSYGLSIMAERAERIRADFSIKGRKPRGTVVSVVIGESREASAGVANGGATEPMVITATGETGETAIDSTDDGRGSVTAEQEGPGGYDGDETNDASRWRSE